MTLTADQRAMLQLLLEGGQSYEDIGSLLGVEAGEVRARARAALRDLGGADPDAEVGLTDYLLGQADPIGRADAARHLRDEAGANDLARKLCAQLQVIAPQAQLPDLPGPGAPASAPAPAPQPARRGGGEPTEGRVAALSGAAGAAAGAATSALSGLSSSQRKLIFGLGAATVLLVAIVLAVTGAFGASEEGTDTAAEATPDEESLTIVPMEPVGGGDGAGQIVFARVGDQPVLQINLTGLQPTRQNENYIVWLYNSPELAVPMGRDQVGEDGNLTATAPVPQEVVPLLPEFQFIDVSLASNQETQRAIRQATNQNQLPGHAGRSVLRGEIPRAPQPEGGG